MASGDPSSALTSDKNTSQSNQDPQSSASEVHSDASQAVVDPDGASDPATPANNHGKANNNQQSPQSGNEHHDKTSLLGLLTAGLLGMAIYDRKKKRN